MSGAHQTIATLKMHGLSEDVGSSENRKIQLTKVAISCLVDERPGRQVQARRGFALRPKILAALWDLWKAKPPGDSVARGRLRVDKGLHEEALSDVVRIYRENLRFAGLADEAGMPEVDEIEEPEDLKVQIGDFAQWESAGQRPFNQPRKVTWISNDGSHPTVEGSSAGTPIGEAHRIEVPPLPPPASSFLSPPPPEQKGGYQVTLTEDRLRVRANVDKAGLEKRIRVLKAHLLPLENDGEASAETADVDIEQEPTCSERCSCGVRPAHCGSGLCLSP